MATSSDELARDALAQQQRASRAAYRAQQEARLVGSPVAYFAALGFFQPLIDFQWDMALPTDDDLDTDSVIRNNDLVP